MKSRKIQKYEIRRDIFQHLGRLLISHIVYILCIVLTNMQRSMLQIRKFSNLATFYKDILQKYLNKFIDKSGVKCLTVACFLLESILI